MRSENGRHVADDISKGIFNKYTDWKQRQEIKVVGRYFCGIKFSLYFAELYEVLKGETPQNHGLQNSIMELHNSIYGAPLQIIQLYMNYGAPSPFTEARE